MSPMGENRQKKSLAKSENDPHSSFWRSGYIGAVVMPTILRDDGYRFFFYSDEGNPPEPPHTHVRQGGDEAKF